MKRDMELIRNILFRFEESKSANNGTKILEDLAEKEVLAEHLKLLEDANFIFHLLSLPSPHGTRFSSGWRITSSGHDFLDSVRDPKIWRDTKNGAATIGGWSVKILGDIATGYIREKAKELGIPV